MRFKYLKLFVVSLAFLFVVSYTNVNADTLQEKTIKLCKFCSIDYYKNSMKWKISSRQRNEFVNDKLFNVFQDRVNFKKI